MTAADAVSECPSLETLAALADQALPDAERAALVPHLAGCPRCRDLVATAVIARREEPARRVLGFRRWWVTGGTLAAAAAAILVGVGVWLRPPADGGLSVLLEAEEEAAAAGKTRSVEARLSGGFPYGPEPRVMRGPSPPLPYEMRMAIARVDQEAAQHPSPATRHAQALARLLDGKSGEAVDLLSALVRERPDDAPAWSDLAGAQLARGGVQDAAAALGSTDQALQRTPRLPEALFNRALALERMGRTDDARAAWNVYLAADGASLWAAEARVRKGRLEEAPGSVGP